MKEWLHAFAFATMVLSSGACSPNTSPSSPTARRASLSEGEYMLTISIGSRMVFPGATSSLCVSRGELQIERVRIPMSVRAVGVDWTGESDPQAGTMRMSLRLSEAGIVGTLGGTAREIATNATVIVSSRQPGDGSDAVLTSASTSAIGGDIDGRVMFSTPTGSLSCSDHNWSLAPR